jgi:multiple RNA-binding domain-containing protein 1
LFGKKGEITDCTLKYTKDGRFRKFAFIGFSKETEANDAVRTFNKTFIDTSRIQVDIFLIFMHVYDHNYFS